MRKKTEGHWKAGCICIVQRKKRVMVRMRKNIAEQEKINGENEEEDDIPGNQLISAQRIQQEQGCCSGGALFETFFCLCVSR
eukprot:scaffold182318_cov19-Tisochrysis_lutea.AAC.1